MNEDIPESDGESQASAVLIGERLHSAREAKSITVSEVAQRLNLEEHVVRELEQDNYEKLPELAYIRGYLLAYLRLMELPISLLKSFDKAHPVNGPLLSAYHPVESASSQDGWVRYISIGLAVLLIIALGLWGLEQSSNVLDTEQQITVDQSDNTRSIEKPQATVVVESEFNQTTGLETSTNEAELPAGSQTEISALDVVGQDNIADVETIDEQSTVAQEAEPQMPLLMVKFSGESWVRIDDVDGNTLAVGTYNKGQEINLQHDGEMHLIIGRSRYVELDYMGEVVDLSVYKGGSVGRLVLGKQAE